MSKYGIWKSSHEMKSQPQDAWDIINSDEWIGEPIEVFDSKEEAVAKLRKDYNSSITERHYVTKFYECEVYFVAEAIKYDEDEPEALDNLAYGDGIEATPIETYDDE